MISYDGHISKIVEAKVDISGRRLHFPMMIKYIYINLCIQFSLFIAHIISFAKNAAYHFGSIHYRHICLLLQLKQVHKLLQKVPYSHICKLSIHDVLRQMWPIFKIRETFHLERLYYIFHRLISFKKVQKIFQSL